MIQLNLEFSTLTKISFYVNQNMLARTPSMRLLMISQREDDRIWKSQILQSWQVQAQDVMQQ